MSMIGKPIETDKTPLTFVTQRQVSQTYSMEVTRDANIERMTSTYTIVTRSVPQGGVMCRNAITVDDTEDLPLVRDIVTLIQNHQRRKTEKMNP